MKKNSIFLPDDAATRTYGAELAQWVRGRKQVSLYFQGEIGAGKTTLIRSFFQHLGVQGTIKSPTFSLLESYTCPDFRIYHFDLYRLTHPEELEYLGWRECFSAGALCCVEWPERAQHYLPTPDRWITFRMLSEGRELCILK